MYANIIVDITHEQVDRTFQYIVPDFLEDKTDVGVMVNVPFGRGNKLITGWIIELTDKPEYDVDKLKDIHSVVENSVPAISRMVRLAGWLKENYGATMNQALKTVIPVKETVRQLQDKRVVLKVTEQEAQELCETFERKNAKARLRLMRALLERKEIDYSQIKNELNISSATVKALEETGCIRIDVNSRYRNPINIKQSDNIRPTLNREQKDCVDDFIEEYRNNKRGTYLIHGVTGSGKTEVYLNMIEYVISQERQAIVLIPEIALTYQTVQRFYSRFGDKVSIMNSRMSKGERYDQFLRAMNGEISIMIGPRSALFTPFEKLGLIVIDEEHEGAYKSEQTPRYNAREVAEYIVKETGASLVLGSATPSIESTYYADTGRYKRYYLNKRATGIMMPKIYVADLKQELINGNRSIFSYKLQELISDRLNKKQQIMLFLNKRGYAGFVSCRSCGHCMKCPHCDLSLTEHKNGTLVCHTCGYIQPKVTLCPKCGSRYILGFRAGTQQIEELLNRMYPGARVLRMDMDTTTGKGGHEKILSAFARREADILVGTQMIVKGHDFPGVTLVGILAADMSLYASDYRATEKTFQLLVQAAGRAGRTDEPGEVVIQSYTPEHYSIECAANNDYRTFYENEIAFRRLMDYPPVANCVKISLASGNEEKLRHECDRLKIWLQENNEKYRSSEIYVNPPVPANVYKLKDAYIWNIHAKSKERERLTLFIKELEIYIKNDREHTGIMLQYDFN